MGTKIITSNGFTGTEGAGNQIQETFVFTFDIEKCPYLGKESITTLQQYSSGKIGKKKKQVIDRLEDFGKLLERKYGQKIDPIKFLIHLYYELELSVEEIYSRFYNFGYEGNSGLWHIMSNTLNWELRPGSELNERRLRQRRRKNSPALQGLQKNATALKEDNIQRCLNILNQIKKEPDEVIFSLVTFKSFQGKGSKGKKIWYILKYLHGITPSIIYQINIEHDIGARTLARVINTKVEASCVLHDIPYENLSLQSADISYIFQMKKKGKNLEVESL